MKTVICGTRSITDASKVEKAIQTSGFSVTEVLSSLDSGPAQIALDYAIRSSIPFQAFPADWERDGNRAGYLRNTQMVIASDAVIAIWDGQDRSTAQILSEAYRLHKRIFISRP